MHRISSPLRALPTALVVAALAGAATAGDKFWTGPDGFFDAAGSWSPSGVPISGDHAFIGTLPSQDVVADTSFQVTWLDVDSGGSLQITGPVLGIVNATARVDLGGELEIVGGGPAVQLLTEDLWLTGTSRLLLTAGGQLRVTDLFNGGLSTDIIGDGAIRFDVGAAPDATMIHAGRLASTGLIELGGNGSNGSINLDSADIEAINGDVHVINPIITSGAHSGTMTVAGGRSVTIDDSATYHGNATLSSSNGLPAELYVDALGDQGWITVSDGPAILSGPPNLVDGIMQLHANSVLAIGSTADVEARLSQGNGNFLSVDGVLTLKGSNGLRGFVGGGGTLQVADGNEGGGLASLEGNVTVDMPTGIFKLEQVFVQAGANASITASQIGLGDPATAKSGNVIMRGALTVDTPTNSWRFGEYMRFEEPFPTGPVPSINGDEMVVTDGATVLTLGTNAVFNAPWRLESGGDVDIREFDDVVIVYGDTTLAGGEIHGLGRLDVNGDILVTGAVTIHPDLFTWDANDASSELIVGDSGELVVDCGTPPRTGLISNQGILDVTNYLGTMPIPWNVWGTFQAKGGSLVRGSQMTLDNGGTIELGAGLAPSATIEAPFRLGANGSIVTSTLASLTLAGPTIFDGQGGPAEITGPGDVVQTGDLDVVSSTSIVVDRYDWDGGFADSSSTIVRSGATFSVNVDSFEFFIGADNVSAAITLEPGAEINVVKDEPEWIFNGEMLAATGSIVSGNDLRNFGRIEGATRFEFVDVENGGTIAPTGTLELESANYVQLSGGEAEYEITGPVLGSDHGWIFCDIGAAVLDGRVEVALGGGYVPGIGESFTLVSAGDVFGFFSEVDAPGFDIVYDINPGIPADNVIAIYNGCPADVTHDGSVDIDDIVEVVLAFGPCQCAIDVNDDDVVDIDDLVAVVLAWGACP